MLFPFIPQAKSLLDEKNQDKLYVTSEVPNSAIGFTSSTAGAIVLTIILVLLLISLLTINLFMSHMRTELSDLYFSKPAAIKLHSIGLNRTALQWRPCLGTVKLK